MAQEIKGSDIAFPEIITDLEPNGLQNTYSYGGLTKREYFAGLAMQGMLANDWRGYSDRDDECNNLTKTAINYADALISELNKQTT